MVEGIGRSVQRKYCVWRCVPGVERGSPFRPTCTQSPQLLTVAKVFDASTVCAACRLMLLQTRSEPSVEFAKPTRLFGTPLGNTPGSSNIGPQQHAASEKGEELCTLFSQGVGDFVKQVVAWDGRSWE